MRSFLAALKTLVLPYNATTGPRIILDGINGLIAVYNAIRKVLQIDSDGLHLYGVDAQIDLGVDEFGSARLEFFDPGTTDSPAFISSQGGLNNGLNLESGSTEFSSASSSLFLADTIAYIDLFGPTNEVAVILDQDKIRIRGDVPIVVEDEVWNDVTLQNGWANRAGLDKLQYRKLPDGTVHLRGSIAGGTSASGTRIGSVPAGYRPPTHDTVLNIVTDNGPAAYAAASSCPRLQVQQGGDLFIYGTGPGPLWIDTRWTSVA